MPQRILIVDDQESLRDLLEVTLNAQARIIFQVESAEEAISLAQQLKPSLIVMDLQMPNALEGLGATRQLDARVAKGVQTPSNCFSWS